MKSYLKNDVVMLEVFCRNWRFDFRSNDKNHRYPLPGRRFIKFDKPQNRQQARIVADRLEKYTSVFRVNCVVSNGGIL